MKSRLDTLLSKMQCLQRRQKEIDDKKILNMSFKQRQLAFCTCILSHGVFADTLKRYFETGTMPNKNEIIQIMKKSNLYNVNSSSTYERRSSTIKGWINWIVELINE